MVGNIVVPGQHVVKIQLDKKFQAAYDEHTVRKLPLKVEEQKEEESKAEETEETAK